MRPVAFLMFMLLSTPCFAANEKEPAPRPAPHTPAKPTAWDLSSAWLNAIERLRLTPKPGEIHNSGFKCGIDDIIETPKPSAEKIDKIVADYDAEALKLAAKWEGELKTLRATYEAQLLVEIPEARRDAATKLLAYSHENAFYGIGREEKFMSDLAVHQAELRGRNKEETPEQHLEATGLLNQWVKEERNKISKEFEDIIDSLRSFLTSEEAQRLEKFNRYRAAAEAPPAPDKK